MASADVQNDMTICSICFEKFKTPRILPCSHIFCHSCVSSYIVSSCASKEAPVGFPCPLCREFVPAPAAFDKPETWTNSLPVCDIIEKFLKIRESNLCLPCQREDDEEVATDICITCEEPICGNCAKYHRRNLTSRTHLIVAINLMEPSILLKSFKSAETNSSCPEHPDNQIELHCNDHRKPCCSLCAGTVHRKCSNVESIQQVTEKAKKQRYVQMLLGEMNTFEKRLHTIKESQEINLTKLDSSSDNIKEEIKMLRRKINDHLDRLEDEHLNELSKITQHSRELLSRNIDSLSDRIHFSRNCIQSLPTIEDLSDACFMKKYYRIRESFEELNTTPVQVHNMKLESNISKDAHEITEMKYMAAIKMVHSKHEISLDFSQFVLCPAFEFDIPNDDVYCGVLISDGTLTLAKYGSSKSGLQQYTMNSNSCKPTKEYRTDNCLFGLVVNDDFIYTTNRNENNITIISSKTFTLRGKIPIDEQLVPYGICQWKEYLLVACQTAILKYSISGSFIQRYPVDFNTLFVTVIRSGNIVYSNTSQNYVESMDQNGHRLWKYRNAKLRSPHGVDKDETESPVGFSCPLCREFVPAQADIGKLETWAAGLPVCKILDKLSKTKESNFCAACQRENDEEEATDICITCEESICANCAKYHRRNLITCTHVVVPLKEPSVVLQSVISSVKNGSCPDHPDKEIELHCGEHCRTMCTLCATTEHRKCLDVQTIQSVAEKTKKGGSLQKLLRKVNNYEQEMLSIKKKQEDNLSEIDSASDSIMEETKKLRIEVNAHLDKLEQVHLEELTDVTKKSKEILNKNIDSVSDRIHYSRHCMQSLQNLEDASDACFMKEYNCIREKFEVLKLETINLKENEIKLKSNISEELRKIKHVERFSKLKVLHSRRNLLKRKDIEEVSFSLIYEIQLPDANICGGNFISDEVIALAKYNSTKKGLWQARLKRNAWDQVRESDTEDTYFDVLYSNSELYITNQTKRSVIVMASRDFTTVREFIMQDNLVPYGLAIWESFVFVACQIAILKYDLQGKLVYRYPVEKSSLYVTVTHRGHIVHSNVKTDTVTCIDEKGVSMWKYVSPKLSGPCSVDRDALDNLYVGGSKSNNIHILSSFGSLIRIIECIPCPAFMKVGERGDMCCVCCNWKNIRVYEIK